MTFCTACGRTLAAPLAAATMPATAAAASVPSGRPVGRMVALWKPIVFPFITLGIYVYFFWWRISGEIDAYAGSRSRALVRTGVLVTVVGGILFGVATISILAPLYTAAFESASEDPAALDAFPTESEINALYLASPTFLSGAALLLAGYAVLWTGLWRAWTALAADEGARGVTDPIKPPILLGILLAGPLFQAISFFVPGIGILSFVAGVAVFYVLYTTQAHLNRAWVANGAPPIGA